jgi:hypothetical protein
MNNLGPDTSRVLDPTATGFLEVILQQGKPPMDAEFNLLQEIATGQVQAAVLRGVLSGWLGNETGLPSDFVTNPSWSNWFQFGQQRSGERASVKWAIVNGWLIPVAGTRTGSPPGAPDDTDTYNKIALDPPPANSGDFRIDFIFLETWLARVAPNPSTANKPNASAIYRYGNVEGGATFLPDNLIDPALGFETSQRVQLQYRIRVVKGLVGFTGYPDGFDPAIVRAKGAYDPTNPDTTTAYTFQNMRQTLGDPGLWRAGDGTVNNLGTVDGYVYAVPIAAVFRRNGVAWNGDPSQNLNGSFNRDPSAVARALNPKIFASSVTIASVMTATSTSVTLSTATNLPFPATPATPVTVRIGDEIVQYSSIVGTTMNISARGQNGTSAEAHQVGAPVKILSGRPDGLFADQVAGTDILDLRHAVNPNGFDYQAMLESNLDKLLKGELRTNWKRSGAGPQGPFVAYQDKITAGAVSLGVTKLDAPDKIRTIFSDASCLQPIEIVAFPNGTTSPADVGVAWGLRMSIIHTPVIGGRFSPGDTLVIPVNQLKAGLPGGDADQVRWMIEGFEMRVDGNSQPIDPSTYALTPTTPTSSDPLTITLQAGFPTTTRQLYIKAYAIYGAGRGLSRRPDAVHSIALLSPSADILSNPVGTPSTNRGMKISWVPLWSKFAGSGVGRGLPTVSEAYVDAASKTVVLQPLQRIEMPAEFITMDGTAANIDPGASPVFTNNAGSSAGSNVLTDMTVNFITAGVTPGMAVIISNGPQPGRYVVSTLPSSVTANTLTLDRPLYATTSGLSYAIYTGQGLMPLRKRDGVTAKWAQTDPLNLFSGNLEAATPYPAATKNIYVTLPRHLVPGWGEYKLPILRAGTSIFAEGVNYMLLSQTGGTYTDNDRNFVPYAASGVSFACFSTLDFNPPGTNPAAYNAAFGPVGGKTYAGIRKYTDTRGLMRQGLELPPFYGVARLFAVYEANDYKVNGSAYNDVTRVATGSPTSAKNLLRQNFDGPLFWVEIDEDGDSTFILNADALDLSKSTVNPIVSFMDSTAHFVIEASIFGFDRGSFAPDGEFRLVLTQPTGSAGMRQQANTAYRYNDGVHPGNIGVPVSGPIAVLPGPLGGSDSALINYSRTPYGGDAWGSQTNYIDIGYAPGSLTSGIAYLFEANKPQEANLTRPNQKALEVLASVSFSTTAGTGRISGVADSTGMALNPISNPGAEDLTFYPPTSPVAPRPRFAMGALVNEFYQVPITSKYLGCTERLPLGGLWRDKDFKGGSFTTMPGPLVKGMERSFGAGTGLARTSTLEAFDAVPIPDHGTGEPGVLVHVDGESGNYSPPVVNFRTFRGGSAFSAAGPNPGGEVLETSGWSFPINDVNQTLSATAYLVRNTVTNVGLTEVSAGDELMLLIITTVQPPSDMHLMGRQPLTVRCSTNGFGEGYSAADLYRIEGHPLVRNNVHMQVNPSAIVLTRNPEVVQP